MPHILNFKAVPSKEDYPGLISRRARDNYHQLNSAALLKYLGRVLVAGANFSSWSSSSAAAAP